MSSKANSIVIRELRKEENEAVVLLIRTGLYGFFGKFRKQISLERRNLFIFLSFLVVAYANYFCYCIDYADMYSFYQKDGHKLFVAVIDNRIVGSVAVAKIDAQSADLRRMSIHKDYRRLGIGRRLMQRVEEYSRLYGYKRLELSTSKVQIPAIQLYESGGYRLFKTAIVPLFAALPFSGPVLVYYEKFL